MPVLPDRVNESSEAYQANRAALLAQLAQHDEQLALANAGGGENYVRRHRQRGKLLARERIELILDQDSPFLELSPLAAWGTQFPVGASVVTGVGVIEGVECMLIVNDPTVRGGASNPITFRKSQRAMHIAKENRLPLVHLVESGGADLPTQSDLFIPGGRSFRDITELSAAGIPTVAVVFGNSTAGGAYLPGMSDYTVMIKERSKVFLGGPPLVKMATGEESDDESLGGADMHSRISGLSDYYALDEMDGLRLGRQVVRRLNHRKRGPGPRGPDDRRVTTPTDDGDPPSDPRVPFDPRDVIGRRSTTATSTSSSRSTGTSLVTGFAELHGYPIGILAEPSEGVLFNVESHKAAQFIQLATPSRAPRSCSSRTPPGYMVGQEYEQRGSSRTGRR
jgi:acetyl-CoA carboxylase carboxyltransferase component